MNNEINEYFTPEIRVRYACTDNLTYLKDFDNIPYNTIYAIVSQTMSFVRAKGDYESHTFSYKILIGKKLDYFEAIKDYDSRILITLTKGATKPVLAYYTPDGPKFIQYNDGDIVVSSLEELEKTLMNIKESWDEMMSPLTKKLT